MGINFEAPLLLSLVVPTAILLIWWWKTQTRVAGIKRYAVLVLRSLFFLLIILSLAGFNLRYPVKEETVIFVIDQSASMNQDERILPFLREAIKDKRSEDQYAIISVGQEASIEQPLTESKQLTSLGAVVNPHATNLAEGIRLASGLIPSAARGKIVLITDGKETHGHALKEVQLAKERGIRVDAYYLHQELGNEAVLTNIDLPQRLYLGEEYQVKVGIDSTVSTAGTLRLYEGNLEVGQQRVQIEKGTNQFIFQQKSVSEGFHRYRVELDAENDTVQVNNQSFSFSEVSGKPKVLVIEGHEGAASNLSSALEAGNMEIDVKQPELLPKELNDLKQYSSLILADVQATQMKTEDMKRIQAAVRDLGMGLIMTGGSNSFGMGGWFKSPIEEALPVHMDLRSKEELPSLGLVLVIDKSGSMASGMGINKMELAKEAAIRATEMLNDKDQVGVVAFDGTPWIVVEMQSVKNLEDIQDKIGSIYASGGTEIYSALYEGYEQIKNVKTQRKHVILLTDGQSSGYNDYEGLLEDMKKEKITVSTVAVGEDADMMLLEEIAELGDGRYYLADDPDAIPYIFSKETALASRTFIVEKPHIPTYVGARDWSIFQNKLPFVHAYIATTPKQTAETALLSVENDPILTRWQYGLGRSAAWTTDVEGKWSPEWITWAGYSRMWNQIVSWSFPQVSQGGWKTETSVDGVTGKIKVTLPVGSQLPQQMEAIVLSDSFERESIQLKPVAPGKLEANFSVEEPGSYLIQVLEKQGEQIVASETAGLSIAYSPEYRLTPPAEDSVSSWTKAGGGTMLTSAKDTFTNTLPSKWEHQNISELFLLLATLVWPLDIAVRRVQMPTSWVERWRSLREQRRNRVEAPSEQAAVLGQLKQKKNKGRFQPKPSSPVEQPQLVQTHLEKPIKAGIEKEPQKEPQKKAPVSPSDSATTFNRLLAAKKRGK